MNSESIQYSNAGYSILATFGFQIILLIKSNFRKARDFLIYSQRAQAKYDMNRKRKILANQHWDILRQLPLEEKHRLGMYRFMQ